MKKSIHARFTDFKVKYALSNEKITKMIKEYANSDAEFACSHFCDKYHMKKYVFYKARDFAIVFCLIDNKTFKKLHEKASKNYAAHNPNNTATTSKENFEKLYSERKLFLDSFSDDQIRDIAFKYSKGIPKAEIAKEYDTGTYAIQWLLKKGISYLIVDAKTTEVIQNMIGESLNGILEVRKFHKQKLIECIDSEIKSLELKIACYDFFFKGEIETPSIRELHKELANANKKRIEILRL